MAETWDLYIRKGESLDFEKIGQTVERGKRLPNGTFHPVVHAWIRDERGYYLISQRCATKSNPLRWEPTGGSVLAGETTLQAALREVKEELGIDLKPDNGRPLCRGVRFYDGCDDFVDVWMFDADSKAIRKSLKLQVEEVNAAALMPPDVICILQATDQWISW